MIAADRYWPDNNNGSATSFDAAFRPQYFAFIFYSKLVPCAEIFNNHQKPVIVKSD